MAIKCDMTGILQIPETDPVPFVTGKAVLVDMDSTICTKRFMFLTASKLLIKVGTFHLLTYHNGTQALVLYIHNMDMLRSDWPRGQVPCGHKSSTAVALQPVPAGDRGLLPRQ
eukprot:4594571-Pleurochrysis_carterae.AAC.1